MTMKFLQIYYRKKYIPSQNTNINCVPVIFFKFTGQVQGHLISNRHKKFYTFERLKMNVAHLTDKLPQCKKIYIFYHFILLVTYLYQNYAT